MTMGGPSGRLMWSSRFSPDRPQIRKPINWPRVGAFFLPYWRAELMTLACIVAAAVLGLAPPLFTKYLIDDAIPAGHPFAGVKAMPAGPTAPEVWLLGSSPQSALWAGELALPYSFADFINPNGAEIAARIVAIAAAPTARAPAAP